MHRHLLDFDNEICSEVAHLFFMPLLLEQVSDMTS